MTDNEFQRRVLGLAAASFALNVLLTVSVAAVLLTQRAEVHARLDDIVRIERLEEANRRTLTIHAKDFMRFRDVFHPVISDPQWRLFWAREFEKGDANARSRSAEPPRRRE